MQRNLGIQDAKKSSPEVSAPNIDMVLKRESKLTSACCNHVILSFKCIEGTKQQLQDAKKSFHTFRNTLLQPELHRKTVSCKVHNPKVFCSDCECPVISLGVEKGDLHAKEILDSQLLDFESYVFEQTGQVLKTETGCIRIVVRPHDEHHLEKMYHDIVEGNMITRINEWFGKHSESMEPADGVSIPEYALAVDKNQIDSAMEHFEEKKNTDEGNFIFKTYRLFQFR